VERDALIQLILDKVPAGADVRVENFVIDDGTIFIDKCEWTRPNPPPVDGRSIYYCLRGCIAP